MIKYFFAEEKDCANMSQETTWQDVLGEIIAEASERERIANEIGVHPATLVRWCSRETTPRTQNLRQLIKVLPQPQRQQLLPLIQHIIPEMKEIEQDRSGEEVPYKFVMEVFEAQASTPDLLRFYSISRLILRHALTQLDSEHVGMSITVVRCMPPHRGDGKIHSLREDVGLGTPPWEGDLEANALLLGAESLAGHVTVTCRQAQIGDLKSDRSFLPAYQSEHEVSAAACPIMSSCRVAGCLLLSCTRPNYFQSEARMNLIRGYTALLSLAFEPEDFYEPSCIDLRILPPRPIQRPYINSFRSRVLKLMQDSAFDEHRLTNTEAQQRAWLQIEDDLLRRAQRGDWERN